MRGDDTIVAALPARRRAGASLGPGARPRAPRHAAGRRRRGRRRDAPAALRAAGDRRQRRCASRCACGRRPAPTVAPARRPRRRRARLVATLARRTRRAARSARAQRPVRLQGQLSRRRHSPPTCCRCSPSRAATAAWCRRRRHRDAGLLHAWRAPARPARGAAGRSTPAPSSRRCCATNAAASPRR